ncbi:putative PEP-CTERM system TPR-repeat lipoprotein [Burkholderiales bacterium JOSHI_001]|nr:putative PEP-CTERM system TPR-repeat lipoprotein [Burkholderiales bacterium JOSHI_001]
MSGIAVRRPLSLKRHVLALAASLVLGSPLPAAAANDPKAAKFYEDALGRYQKKDFAGAVIQLKNALQIEKDQLAVQLLMGKALLADNDVIGAEVAFNEALRLGVDRAEVVVPLAQTMLAQGKQQLVLEQPKFLPQGLPRGIQIQLLLVRSSAHTDLGDMREAMRTIEEARAIDPGAPDSWMAETMLRIRMRQFKEAHAAADRAIALGPGQAEPLYLKGTVFHAQSQIQPALEQYGKALKLQPEHGEALLGRAGLLMDLGRPQEAARDLDALQALLPSEPRGAYLRALIAEQKGDKAAAKAALADITNLLDPVPMNFMRYRPQMLLLGGLAHHGLANNEKAKPYLDAVLRLHPQSSVAKLLARIHLSEKNFDKAADLLSTYLKGSPQDAQAMMLLSATNMQLGRHARATALMQEALKTRDTPELHTILGISLIGGGRPDAALTELEATFRKDPSQTHAGVALVGLYLKAGQPKKALAVSDSLVKRQPGQAGFLNLQGMSRAETGDAVGARNAFEQAVKADPAFPSPQLNLARLDSAMRAYDAAGARLEKVLQADDKNVEALIEMGLLAERRGRDADATRYFAKAADVSASADLKPLQALVDHHLRAGRAEAALDASKRLVGKAPEDLSAMLTSARVLLLNNDVVRARGTLTNATRIANFDTAAQVRIAMLQIQARDLAGAQYSLQKGLTSDPANLEALALLAEVETRQGDLVKAEQHAREVLARYPKSAAGFGLLGDLAMARGQVAPAIESYRRAHQVESSSRTLLRLFQALEGQEPAAAHQLGEQWLKSHAQDRQARAALADAYARAANYPAARRHYEQLVKQTPKDGAALNNLANLLLLMNDPSALQVAESALAAMPGNANAIDTVGWASFKAGKTDRALALLRDARLRMPDNPEIRLHLATVLAASGRKAEAREEFEGVVRVGLPSSAVVQEAQAQLKALR